MISSQANPRVKWVRALQLKRKARQEEGVFVIEGIRLARAGIQAGSVPQLVLHTEELDHRERGLLNSMARGGAEVLAVTPSVMRACSSLETPPGIIAIYPMPKIGPPARLDLALIIDQLADPGNLGTLLRTAHAAGAQAVYLTKGTVDPFNPKVVRGAMGAHFLLPLVELALPAESEALPNLRILLAEPAGAVAYHEVDWSDPIALAVGGEAHGASQALREICQGTVRVPMPGGGESLNVAAAAAIILFEAQRQRGVL